MKIVMMGAPGAGKGTQSEIISKKLGIPWISTGDILRAEVKGRTPLGTSVESYMESGELVPDEVIIEIMRKRISEPDCRKGYILDGMPRTIAQAQALESSDIDVDAVLSIETSNEEIIRRMSGRRSCHDCGATYHVISAQPMIEGICDECGGKLERRKDDEPETVKNRLEVYHQETEPLKIFYQDRDIYMQVENQRGVNDTTKLVFEALGI
ncbi:MAG: adenylate kinase [Clostridiales bacterium]|nr:adenylate kinase [Clostridiales bacterium]